MFAALESRVTLINGVVYIKNKKIELIGNAEIQIDDKTYFIPNADKIFNNFKSIINHIQFEQEHWLFIKKCLEYFKENGKYVFNNKQVKMAKKIYNYIANTKKANCQSVFEIHFKELRAIINEQLYYNVNKVNYYYDPNTKTKGYLRLSYLKKYNFFSIKKSLELLRILGYLSEFEFEYVPIQDSYIIIIKISSEIRDFETVLQENIIVKDTYELPIMTKEIAAEIKKNYYLDYNSIITEIQTTCSDYYEIVDKLADKLQDEWSKQYEKTRTINSIIFFQPHPDSTFYYLMDFPYQKPKYDIKNGVIEDRVVAVYGISKKNHKAREENRINSSLTNRHNFEELKVDRGHFIAHSIGGDDEAYNLFIQKSDLNRGISDEGKLYRKMEEHCKEYEGVFCFSRPLYYDDSSTPFMIEFGILKDDKKMWVEVFENL